MCTAATARHGDVCRICRLFNREPFEFRLSRRPMSFRGVAMAEGLKFVCSTRGQLTFLGRTSKITRLRTVEFDSINLPTELRALGSFTPCNLENSQRVSPPGDQVRDSWS